MSYLEAQVDTLDAMPFEDHHYFTPHEMDQMAIRFRNLPTDKPRIILSTEKDATRLALHGAWLQQQQLPVFILPVAVEFLFDQGPAFDQMMKDFLLAFES